jgi:hypothetical protein
MFYLNFLTSVGEERLVKLNVEASDNHLVNIHFFYPLGAQKLFGENWQCPINPYEFNVRPLTDTVSRSSDDLDMQMMKNIAKLVLDNYFYHLLLLLEITLKSLVEKKNVLLRALNAINHI